MGRHRERTRNLFARAIGLLSRSGQVCLGLEVAGKPVTIKMRRGNEADYLVAGELVMGGYPLPNEPYFVPTAVVDGGANIGVFALQAHAQFPGIPLKCYEPDAANIAQLKLNLAANSIAGQIVPKALWSETADLFFHPGMSYSGFVSREKSQWPISCELPELPEGCWLKLDIEGAEYEVLPALLRDGRQPVLISMEIHDFSARGQAIVDLLRGNGYRIEGALTPDAPCVSVVAYKPRQAAGF